MMARNNRNITRKQYLLQQKIGPLPGPINGPKSWDHQNTRQFRTFHIQNSDLPAHTLFGPEDNSAIQKH